MTNNCTSRKSLASLGGSQLIHEGAMKCPSAVLGVGVGIGSLISPAVDVVGVVGIGKLGGRNSPVVVVDAVAGVAGVGSVL